MDAKIIHFSELSNFLSEKSSVCNDFLLLLDRFKLSQSLHKRFTDYETFGELFRDIREGLLELTFIKRLLPIIAELLEKIARLFNSTLDDLLERAMADEETKHDLECILRYNPNFKERL